MRDLVRNSISNFISDEKQYYESGDDFTEEQLALIFSLYDQILTFTEAVTNEQ